MNWRACSASPRRRFFRASGAIRTQCRNIMSAHEALVKQIEAALQPFPTLTFAGSAYHGVGISDCVRTGEAAARKFLPGCLRSCRAPAIRTIGAIAIYWRCLSFQA